MTEMNEVVIEKVKDFCKKVIECSRCRNLPFHNWQHTKDVVENSKFLAKHENLPEKTVEELIIASYFHDIGNIKGTVGHEKLSCKYAQEFLTEEGYPDRHIINVISNIKATEMPQQPETLSQKVICDADLAHLGKSTFSLNNSNLRQEWERYNGQLFTDEQWTALNVNFLESHSFHTKSAEEQYNEQKRKNIKKFISNNT